MYFKMCIFGPTKKIKLLTMVSLSRPVTLNTVFVLEIVRFSGTSITAYRLVISGGNRFLFTVSVKLPSIHFGVGRPWSQAWIRN